MDTSNKEKMMFSIRTNFNPGSGPTLALFKPQSLLPLWVDTAGKKWVNLYGARR